MNEQEDIFDNAFFVYLRKHTNLYKEVEDNCYLLCIPQKRALTNYQLTPEDLGKLKFTFTNYSKILKLYQSSKSYPHPFH